MHESLRLYDAALAILDQEYEAMEKEEEERLAELCEKRALLLEKAWEQRAGCPPDLLLCRLKAIQTAQANVATKARLQMDALRQELQSSRRESTRLAGYGKAVGNGQNAFILRKEG